MANWQRITLGIAALIGWVVLEGVSISANIKFAYSLGHTVQESYIMAAGSVASDLFKAAAPVAVLYFLATRRWTAFSASAAVGIVAFAFSIVAATGFMSSERYRAYHEAKLQMDHTKELRADIKKESEAKSWIPENQKPVAVLEAERAAALADRRYRVTDGCTNARNANEEWCRGVRQLDVQIAAAKAAEEAESKIEEKRTELYTKGRDYGDAQIQFVSEFTSVSEEKVLIAIILLAVALIELGSTLGLTIALGLLSPPDSAVGRVLGTAFSVVNGGKNAEPPKPAPKAPTPEAVRKVAAPGGFEEPAAIKPDAGGLKNKLRPVTRPVVAKVSAA